LKKKVQVMARFLITCWPFTGHVLPQVSIAKELQARGHRVAFYTGSSAVALLEDEGFDVFPFVHLDERRVLELIKSVDSCSPTRRPSPLGAARIFKSWLVDTIPDQVTDLRRVVEEWAPDGIITDLSVWGPILVIWETTGIPVALSSTFLGPLVPGPDSAPWGLNLPPVRGPWSRFVAHSVQQLIDVLATGLRKRVDAIRATYGLAPMGCSVNAFTGRLPLYLVPSIRELDYNRRDLPASVHYVGPCVWHKASERSSLEWLGAVPADRPWVHVTEGTLHYQEPFVLRAAADGLANQEMEVIMTTGPQRDPGSIALGAVAPNVHVTQWLNHTELLPRCRAIVTTGGAGTVIAALRLGVPLVIIPTTWEKPETARRISDAGVGVRIAARKCSPARIREAVERVLREPSFELNSRQLAERLASEPGPAGAADLLESMVGRVLLPASVA
jgi:MGT family glycosyltransferase